MSVERVKLRQVCEIERGGINPQARPDQVFAHYSIPAYDDGKGPMLETGSAIKSQKTRISKGTVLVSKLNPRIPRVWIVDDEQADQRICSTEFVPLQPDTKRLLPDYLAYGLRYLLSTGQITGGTSAATKSRERARPDVIADLAIPLPRLNEQRSIVDLLSRAEGIIRLRREARKKAAEIIPALFLDMFGDPATNPKGWDIRSLGDLLAEAPVLGTMLKPSNSKAAWLDLRVANIQNGELQLDDKKWLELRPDLIDRFALRAGDVLLARAIGSVDHLGKTVIVEPDGNWTFDSHLMRLRLDQSRILPVFLKAFLESKSGRDEFLKYTRRSAVQFNINGKEIRRLRIPLPSIAKQKQFATRCRDIRTLNAQQADALNKADSIFGGLLGRIFTGQDQIGSAALTQTAI